MSHRRRTSLRMLVAVSALAIVAAACGSVSTDSDITDSDITNLGATTVHSDDGVLTIGIPEGAAADGVEVELALLNDSDLAPELLGDDLLVAGYELSPDGAEFSPPLTVEFRINPAELGLDLADGAVPVGLLLTQDPSGEYEHMADVVLSREDGMVVARATLTHFSPAFLVLSATKALALVPDSLVMTVGQTVQVGIHEGKAGSYVKILDVPGDGVSAIWSAKAPNFAAARVDSFTGSISCTVATDAVVPEAFGIHTQLRPEQSADLFIQVFGGLDLFGLRNLQVSFDLAGEATCSEGPSTSEKPTNPEIDASTPTSANATTDSSTGDTLLSTETKGDGQGVVGQGNVDSQELSFWVRSGQKELLVRCIDEGDGLVAVPTLTDYSETDEDGRNHPQRGFAECTWTAPNQLLARTELPIPEGDAQITVEATIFQNGSAFVENYGPVAAG